MKLPAKKIRGTAVFGIDDCGEDSSVVVVGDVHGQLHDVIFLLRDAGLPSENRFFVFNGDYVDRGAWGLETFLLLLAWKHNHYPFKEAQRQTGSSLDERGLSPNEERGIGLLWGPDCTEEFLKKYHLKVMCGYILVV
ncbi:hypothetical protein HHK36_013576 [Tetracentron sinense]|uniref:Serine/threonine specific protein phosphatases domain-containing protein n=1 Tax=Tetracentron sinense TaxID=13715 RepID=A0A835DHH2_TETSI|nr:hypothetical protein HHK36_013576 [Tetracentron sinense]